MPDVRVAGVPGRLVGPKALDPVVGEVQPQEGQRAHIVESVQVEGANAVVGEGEELEAVQVLESLVLQVRDPVPLQAQVL